jgi:hypothetical protein
MLIAAAYAVLVPVAMVIGLLAVAWGLFYILEVAGVPRRKQCQ